jgi:hypothetical protein
LSGLAALNSPTYQSNSAPSYRQRPSTANPAVGRTGGSSSFGRIHQDAAPRDVRPWSAAAGASSASHGLEALLADTAEVASRGENKPE